MVSKKEIDDFLRNCFFAVLSYQTGNGLASELMVFSHHIDGRFFLTTQKVADTFHSMASSPQVSLLIYKEEELLNDINFFSVSGSATVITDFDSPLAQEGFAYIGDKSPRIRNIILEEDRNKHTLIMVEAQAMSFTNFGDLKVGKSITVLDLP